MSSYVLYNYLLSGTLFWQPAGCCQTWPAACRYIRSCGAFHLLHRIFSYQIAYFRPYFLKKSLHHGTLEQPRHDDKFEYKKLRSMQSMGEAFYIHCRMAHSQRENYLFENCGALRAALRPYFLRSFILGSLVRNPAALRTGL